MTAFQRAVDLGYTYLETDVQVTADGVPLAFHDARLDRVTDQRGMIGQLPWSQVGKARIAGIEPIPLLSEVLATWPEVRVNLDVKSLAGVAATADVLHRTRAVERVCVGSFSDRRIESMRKLVGPELCTSLGPRAVLRFRSLSRLGRVFWRPRGDCLQVPARVGGVRFVDARLVGAAHGIGLPVHVWTVNDRDEMRRLLDLGVDGIFTDRCDVLRDVLRDRGAWPTR